MHIEVTRSGGLAGLTRHGALDTSTHPDGPHLAALAEAVLTTPRDSRGVVPDGFVYEVTVGERTAVFGDPRLTPAQRELVTAILNEGA